VLKGALAEQTASSGAIDERQKELEAGIASLSADVPTLSPEEIQERLDLLQLEAAGIRVSSFEVTLGLGVDALGVTVLDEFATQVSGGQALLAADIPALTGGLSEAAVAAGQLATGSAELSAGLQEATDKTGELAAGLGELATNSGTLSGGLTEAAGKIPSYTDDQQKQIATVVTNPIVTEQTVSSALPTPAAAIAAVAVPLALWLGAFAIYLLLTPFTRRALDSTASTFRVVMSALAPAAVLAVLQAGVVALVLFAVGAHPAHVVGSILFTLLTALVFVALHQGLVALFGQVGRLLSLALVVVQVVAAAVIIPTGLSSPLYTALAGLLPLSNAITGMQALIGGGSLDVALQAAAALAVFGLIGLVLSLVAASRRRSRDVVVVQPPARALPTGGPKAVTA
jgi:putative membrane protein